MITGVRVRVPATVANVGPGFDALALALDWTNEIHVDPAPQLEIDVQGEGADTISRDADNLVARAIGRVLGATPRACITIVNRFPFGRGFGSSAAAIVGGLVAGRALAARNETDEELLQDAIEMEGHADNVSACMLGGITVSLPGTSTARLNPPPGLTAVVAVAPAPLATHEARRALPVVVSFGDAAATAARAARLTAALATGDTAALLAATDDVLHQPARFTLAPESGALVAELRKAGFAAFLSGAGPSVAALVSEHDAERARDHAARFAPSGWDVRTVGLSPTGAKMIVSD